MSILATVFQFMFAVVWLASATVATGLCGIGVLEACCKRGVPSYVTVVMAGAIGMALVYLLPFVLEQLRL